MKRGRGFWVALVIFLLLAAYVRYVELRRSPGTAGAAPPFLAVEPARLSAVTVAFRSDTTRMEKRDGTWWITRPVEYPADPTAVEALLSRCRSLEVIRTFPFQDGQESRYGLVPLYSWLRFDLNDGSSRTLQIGNIAPAKPAFYVRVAGENRVGLLSEPTVDNFFLKETDDWRQRLMFRHRPGETVRFELESPGHRVVVAREAPGEPWRIVEPFPGPADPAVTEEFVKGLAAAKARSFPDDDPASPARYGLSPPSGTITFRHASGALYRLELGHAFKAPDGEQVYARMSGRPEVLGVPTHYLRLTRQSDAFFRRKLVFPDPIAGYAAFLLRAGADSAFFEPDASGIWRRRGERSTPGAPPPDRKPFLESLVQSRADSILSAGGEAGAWVRSESVRLEVEARRRDGGLDRLLIGAPRPGPEGREYWPARLRSPRLNRDGEVLLLEDLAVRPALALVGDPGMF